LLSHIQGPAQGGKAGGSELPVQNLTKKRVNFNKSTEIFLNWRNSIGLVATNSFTPYTFAYDKPCTLSPGPTTPLAP
jgi:hypothetical protein